VRDVFKRLKNKGVQTTVSSVAVVLDRLHSLGLLKRRSAKGKGGTHYFYSLKKSRSEFEQEMLERAIDNLLKTFGPKARAHLAARLARS
jgi:predicted transcriptional regulator